LQASSFPQSDGAKSQVAAEIDRFGSWSCENPASRYQVEVARGI